MSRLFSSEANIPRKSVMLHFQQINKNATTNLFFSLFHIIEEKIILLNGLTFINCPMQTLRLTMHFIYDLHV